MCVIKICCRGFEHIRLLADVNTLSSLWMLISDSILRLIDQVVVVEGGEDLHGPLRKHTLSHTPFVWVDYVHWWTHIIECLHHLVYVTQYLFIIWNVLSAKSDLQFWKQHREAAATS